MTTKKPESEMNDKSDDTESSEAHAYTPGLKVKRAMTIDKLRRLPLPGEVLHKVGEKVNYDTKVAKTEISGEQRSLRLPCCLVSRQRI